MTLEEYNKKRAKIPDAPGVYYFMSPRKQILYIGKAASLRDRTRSYFVRDIAEVRSPLIWQMVQKARSIDWRQTDSVLEALILEANLIKSHKPRFNTDEKDDKSWNYVVITKEEFPRVLLVRGNELREKLTAKSYMSTVSHIAIARSELRAQRSHSLASLGYKLKATFGPFPHGLQLKEALKIVRKIFPYRDTCVPYESPRNPASSRRKSSGRRPCFNRQIGLCPGVCTGEISKEEYARTIRHICQFFEGKKKTILRELAREMHAHAKEEEFEKANHARKQLFALQHIQDVSLIKAEYRVPNFSGSFRMEAYDVAHMAGKLTVGVMVVLEDGSLQKSHYRTFHIKSASPGDDIGALTELLSRRLAHDEWPAPRLIIVDGNKAQLNAARLVLEHLHMQIPVVGVVKDEHHRPKKVVAAGRFDISNYEQAVLLANAEAHRFAISRYRRRLQKDFL